MATRMTRQQAEQAYEQIAQRHGYTPEQMTRLRNSPLDPEIRTAHIKGLHTLVEVLATEALEETP